MLSSAGLLTNKRKRVPNRSSVQQVGYALSMTGCVPSGSVQKPNSSIKAKGVLVLCPLEVNDNDPKLELQLEASQSVDCLCIAKIQSTRPSRDFTKTQDVYFVLKPVELIAGEIKGELSTMLLASKGFMESYLSGSSFEYLQTGGIADERDGVSLIAKLKYANHCSVNERARYTISVTILRKADDGQYCSPYGQQHLQLPPVKGKKETDSYKQTVVTHGFATSWYPYLTARDDTEENRLLEEARTPVMHSYETEFYIMSKNEGKQARIASVWNQVRTAHTRPAEDVIWHVAELQTRWLVSELRELGFNLRYDQGARNKICGSYCSESPNPFGSMFSERSTNEILAFLVRGFGFEYLQNRYRSRYAAVHRTGASCDDELHSAKMQRRKEKEHKQQVLAAAKYDKALIIAKNKPMHDATDQLERTINGARKLSSATSPTLTDAVQLVHSVRFAIGNKIIQSLLQEDSVAELWSANITSAAVNVIIGALPDIPGNAKPMQPPPTVPNCYGIFDYRIIFGLQLIKAISDRCRMQDYFNTPFPLHALPVAQEPVHCPARAFAKFLSFIQFMKCEANKVAMVKCIQLPSKYFELTGTSDTQKAHRQTMSDIEKNVVTLIEKRWNCCFGPLSVPSRTLFDSKMFTWSERYKGPCDLMFLDLTLSALRHCM
jgi:hypothetical protein